MKSKKAEITPFMERLQQLMNEWYPEEDPGDFGQRLTQFAALCKLPEPTMRSIMLGGVRTSIDKFKKICDGSQVSPRWLLWGDRPGLFLGDRLKTARQKLLDKTAKEMAEILNVPIERYIGYESARYRPPDELITAFSKLTGRSESWLCTGVEDLDHQREKISLKKAIGSGRNKEDLAC